MPLWVTIIAGIVISAIAPIGIPIAIVLIAVTIYKQKRRKKNETSARGQQS